MKKNKHRLKIPEVSGSRYRFTLPEELREVKLCAFAQGLLNAYAQKEQGLDLSPEGIRAAAIEAALSTEKEVYRGRQGSNQPVLFRETFADMAARIHTAMYAYLEEEPGVYFSFQKRPPQQRIANAYVMAETFLDRVEQLIAQGQPVVFDW